MDLGARRAGVADLDRLAALAAEAVAEQAEGRGGAIWARRESRALPAADSLRAALEDADHLVLAGTIDEAIVGYAVAAVEVLRDGSSLGRVEDIYVEAEGRAVGLGEALIDEIVAWCGERACVGIDAFVLPGNRETKNFFETFGFTARAIVVHRKLR